jgi:signal transduction histidine kinase
VRPRRPRCDFPVARGDQPGTGRPCGVARPVDGVIRATDATVDTAAENEPMVRGRRGIRERLPGLARAVLHRSGPSAPLSRRNRAFDAGLAFALGLIAILTAGHDDKSRDVGPLPPGTFPTVPPERPLPPGPEPYGTVPGAEWGGLALLLMLIAAPLAFRRRYPLSMLWVVLVTASFTVDVGDEAPLRLSFYVCVIAAYSAAIHSPYRIPALASLPAAAFLFQEFQSGANGPALGEAITAVSQDAVPFLILLPIGVAAYGLRSWRSRADAEQARVAALEREHAEAVRRATARERARIARELHDVVTHNVSVMVIQAGAARKVLDSEPAQAREALLAVEAGGRAAMTELRHVMGLLTIDSDESEPELAPQPGLSQVEPLVERVRAGGVPVELVVTGTPGPLPDGVDLAAYRVVQEALTNTVKHAAGAPAVVRIDHGADRLWIEVTDAGGRASGPERTEPSGTGQGLIGLRERLAVYGGSLRAGPRVRGGYRVEAVIPFDTADAVRLPVETP